MQKRKSEGMKRLTLSRAGFSNPQSREVSDLKAGQFTVGHHVMIAVNL